MAPSVLTQPPTSKLQSINIRSMIPELSRVSNQGLVSGLGINPNPDYLHKSSGKFNITTFAYEAVL